MAAQSILYSGRIPNLRNGKLVEIAHAAPREAIPHDCKWVGAEGLSHTELRTPVGLYAFVALQIAGHIQGVDDATRPGRRLAGLVMGGVRAGAAMAFQLNSDDMMAAECLNSQRIWQNHALSSATGAGTASALATAFSLVGSLSAEEQNFVGLLVHMGTAVPVLQGWNLMASGHHYIANTSQAFKAVENQVFSGCSIGVMALKTGMGTDFGDKAFHKACHPINMALKMGWAQSIEVKDRLNAAGLSSATVRLPAMPSGVNAAKAAMAALMKAQATYHETGGDFRPLIAQALAMIDYMSTIPAHDSAARLRATETVTNWYNASMVPIATAAGIIESLTEIAGGARSTIIRAHSVERAMKSEADARVNGQTIAKGVNRARRDKIQAGDDVGVVWNEVGINIPGHNGVDAYVSTVAAPTSRAGLEVAGMFDVVPVNGQAVPAPADTQAPAPADPATQGQA